MEKRVSLEQMTYIDEDLVVVAPTAYLHFVWSCLPVFHDISCLEVPRRHRRMHTQALLHPLPELVTMAMKAF